MNLSVDTALYLTDEHTVGLYTSIDNFEEAIEDRALVDMVEEYCRLFELPDVPHVISADCCDLIRDLRVELVKALELVDQYIDATEQDILNRRNNDLGINTR